MSDKEKTIEDFPILNSLPPFTDKEREQINDITVAIWHFFGKPRGDALTDYFIPVELAARLLKMRSAAERLEFFNELREAESTLSKFFMEKRGGNDSEN